MFAKNVKYLRQRRRMTQQELSDLLGYKTSVTVHKWETGENTPPVNAMVKVARVFGVSLEDLAGVDLERRDADASAKIDASAARVVPIISAVEIEDGIIVKQEASGIFHYDDSIRADLCIIMPDDSMRGAGICRGDHVLVRRDYEPISGRPYAVAVGGVITVRVITWEKGAVISSRGDLKATLANDNCIVGACAGVLHEL